MQPYFFPYAGYFRLFTSADLFVVYDCVQFPRRGWVHRNRVTDAKGELAWLTLPLTPAPVSARISSMRFATDARVRMEDQIRRFPLLRDADAGLLRTALRWDDLVDGAPVTDYLHQTLSATAAALGINTPMMRSSTLDIPADIPGQARILEICRAVGADAYVNPPGGRDLYDAAEFKRRGVSLRFLAPWEGPYASSMETLLADGGGDIARLVREQSLA